MSGRSGIGFVLALSGLFLAGGSRAETVREQRSTLLTLGGAYTVEAGACDRSARSFRVASRRPIDVWKTARGQVVSGVFLKERDRAGRAGWRNVSVSSDGLAVEFELFAQGTGEHRTVPGEGRQCVGGAPARAVVDVEAWIVDP